MPRVDGDPVVKVVNCELPEGLVDEAGSGQILWLEDIRKNNRKQFEWQIQERDHDDAQGLGSSKLQLRN